MDRRTKWVLSLAMAAAFPTGAQPAQDTVRALLPGLWLPVELRRGVVAGKTAVGTPVEAGVTQRVPLGNNRFLDRHTKLRGVVVLSKAGNKPQTGQSEVQIRFTSIESRGQAVPVQVTVLAVANFVDVSDTAVPVSNPSDRGNPSAANWTTRQVGGDEVFRSGWVGDVCNTVMKKVGNADFNGVYSVPVALAGIQTPLPRAVGAFSTSARGLYGFNEDVTMTSTGGVFTLRSAHKAVLHGGDNLLVEILS